MKIKNTNYISNRFDEIENAELLHDNTLYYIDCDVTTDYKETTDYKGQTDYEYYYTISNIKIFNTEGDMVEIYFDSNDLLNALEQSLEVDEDRFFN
jgi:hypothetical protein